MIQNDLAGYIIFILCVIIGFNTNSNCVNIVKA